MTNTIQYVPAFVPVYSNSSSDKGVYVNTQSIKTINKDSENGRCYTRYTNPYDESDCTHEGYIDKETAEKLVLNYLA